MRRLHRYRHRLAVFGATSLVVGALVMEWPVQGATETIRILADTNEVALFARVVGGNNVEVVSAQWTPHATSLNELPTSEFEWIAYGHLNRTWLERVQARLNGGDTTDAIPITQRIRLLDVPESARRHNHANGNPHIYLDPVNAAFAMRAITEELKRRDGDRADHYEANFREAHEVLRTFTQSKMREHRDLRGLRVAVYHDSFAYLARRFGIDIAITMEPQPGAAPDTSRYRALAGMMQNNHVQTILLSEEERSFPIILELERNTGARKIYVPTNLDNHESCNLQDYTDMLSEILARLSASRQETHMSLETRQ